MATVAEVKLWGRTIGAVMLNDGQDVAAFEYDAEFVKSGVQVSPIMMPLSNQVYTFPDLSRNTYHGLPGLLADSLPDKFGNILIDTWLAAQGREASSFNVIERLCYTGERGMGALEYAPASGPKAKHVKKIEIDKLVQLASEILTHRDSLNVSFAKGSKEQAMADILRVGTSAGGARAKAVIAWNPKTNEVRSGQVQSGNGFEYWLLKFDGVSGNKDKELEDPKGYGAIEYGYYKMARDCGIEMGECRLFEENNRRHFMTKRFDRVDEGKLHMQSLCAIGHYDYNLPSTYSYEQALLVLKKLELPMQSIEQLFRRIVFNIVGRNQDDHVKNMAFLMDKNGDWSLAPAFDLTYSYNPSGAWTAKHQMSLNSKFEKHTIDDFEEFAKTASMKRGRAAAIVKEVTDTMSRWREYADDAKVDPLQRDQIFKVLRLDIAK